MLTRREFATLLAAACAPAQDKEKGELAQYYPTPLTVVEKMLEFGELKPGEKMFDLGSGDGRVVIMAAGKFGAQAVGVELDDDLVSRSRRAIQDKGLEKKVRIIHGDLLRQDYSSADLITLYLLPDAYAKVRPLLEKQLKRGARVVAHDFPVTGWTEEKSQHIDDDGEGRSHSLYLYRR